MCTEDQKLGKTFGSQAFFGVIIIGVIFFKHFDLRNNVFLCLGQMSLCVMLIFRWPRSCCHPICSDVVLRFSSFDSNSGHSNCNSHFKHLLLNFGNLQQLFLNTFHTVTVGGHLCGRASCETNLVATPLWVECTLRPPFSRWLKTKWCINKGTTSNPWQIGEKSKFL